MSREVRARVRPWTQGPGLRRRRERASIAVPVMDTYRQHLEHVQMLYKRLRLETPGPQHSHTFFFSSSSPSPSSSSVGLPRLPYRMKRSHTFTAPSSRPRFDSSDFSPLARRSLLEFSLDEEEKTLDSRLPSQAWQGGENHPPDQRLESPTPEDDSPQPQREDRRSSVMTSSTPRDLNESWTSVTSLLPKHGEDTSSASAVGSLLLAAGPMENGTGLHDDQEVDSLPRMISLDHDQRLKHASLLEDVTKRLAYDSNADRDSNHPSTLSSGVWDPPASTTELDGDSATPALHGEEKEESSANNNNDLESENHRTGQEGHHPLRENIHKKESSYEKTWRQQQQQQHEQECIGRLRLDRERTNDAAVPVFHHRRSTQYNTQHTLHDNTNNNGVQDSGPVDILQLVEHLKTRGLGDPVMSTHSHKGPRTNALPPGIRARCLPRNPSTREKIKGRARLDCELANLRAVAFCEQERSRTFRTASADLRDRDVLLLEEEERDNLHKDLEDGHRRAPVQGDDAAQDEDEVSSIVGNPLSREELFFRIESWALDVEQALNTGEGTS